ncbi:MAG TPA: metallophosphoesterase [Polyangiaceae bacterium]|jgi:DNA repair exonuclease SbcCD nuclease subunit
MTFLVHLSDLHMTEDNVAQTLLFERLFDTLTLERDKARPEQSTIVITGDVFDSGTDPPDLLVRAFLKLHARMLEILGDAFTVVLPGNHDRRRFGLLGPNKNELFSALHRAADPARMHVLGQRTPFLAEVVPAALHRLPAHVVDAAPDLLVARVVSHIGEVGRVSVSAICFLSIFPPSAVKRR